MARERSPNREKAKKLYIESAGKMKLTDIAAELNIKDSQVRKWKSQDKWDENSKGALPFANGNVTIEKRAGKGAKKGEAYEEVEEVLENAELTDKQRLFCIYYIRCFNATKAYQKAYKCSYETAAAVAYRMLENVGVREEIERLKKNRLNREMISEEDLFQKYMDIAFADITDYVEFGREEVPVMAIYGPVKVKDEDGNEKQLTKEVNVVKFKQSDEVDGSLISEVKQGKDGASIKLLDKMKAIQWLTDHMGMATEKQKIEMELMKKKMDADKDMPINITFTRASEKHGGR